MKVAIGAVIGAIVTYIVANELITALVTGTATGDTLITTVNNLAAFNRKIKMITLQIRGTLNTLRKCKPTAEPSRMLHIRACGETRRSASLWDGGIVQALVKTRDFAGLSFSRPLC